MDVLEPVKTMVRPALHIVHHMVQALSYLYIRTGCLRIHENRRSHHGSQHGPLQDTFDYWSMIANDKICAVVAAADATWMWKQLTMALLVTRTAELRLDWLGGDDEIDKFLVRLARKRPRATLIA